MPFFMQQRYNIMIKTVFLDLDDTILDFGAAERVAISKTFRQLGLDPTDALLRRYSEINTSQWEAFERGEITRETVLTRRFELLFGELGSDIGAQTCEDIYRGYLGIGHYFVDGAVELLETLFPEYDLYIASNGVAATQNSRLASANIERFFKGIFISETTGHHKPERAYFDYCFAHIPNFDPEKAIIVGDSLTGDILGGKNAGILTCWFNPKGKPGRSDIVPDFEIRRLSELPPLLKKYSDF